MSLHLVESGSLMSSSRSEDFHDLAPAPFGFEVPDAPDLRLVTRYNQVELLGGRVSLTLGEDSKQVTYNLGDKLKAFGYHSVDGRISAPDATRIEYDDIVSNGQVDLILKAAHILIVPMTKLREASEQIAKKPALHRVNGLRRMQEVVRGEPVAQFAQEMHLRGQYGLVIATSDRGPDTVVHEKSGKIYHLGTV